MLLFKIFTLCVIVHSSFSASSQEISTAVDENAILSRALRDITGQYHPELHGDHAHSHTHTTLLEVEAPSVLSVTYGPPPTGYIVPPPPIDHGGTPNGYANCGCELRGRCPEFVRTRMVQLLRDLKNDVVCGIQEYELCCPDDPWAGAIDIFKPLAECKSVETCIRQYGTEPTDVQDFGVIGPCLGLGSVRCLDGKVPAPGPISIVVPIVDYNPPPPVYVPPPPTPVYVPPTPTPLPPVVCEPPPTPPVVVYEAPTTLPPVVYEPPPAPPVVVYEAPTTLPPVVYEPPPSIPVVYQPPTVYEAPVVYEPPAPVTYQPPAVVYEAPVVTYVQPTTYEAPITTYEAPITTYEAPVATYEPPIPSTTYGTPEIDNGIGVSLPPRSSYVSRFPGYGRRHRYPYSNYGYGNGYPYSGYGFRKHFGFSKIFG